MWSELSSGWKLHIVVCCLYIVAMVVTLSYTYALIGLVALVMFGMSILTTSLVLWMFAFLQSRTSSQEKGAFIFLVLLIHSANFVVGFLFRGYVYLYAFFEKNEFL